jgi:hypothetical protein
LNFTGNRRFSVTALERERLLQADEFGRPGWGRAMWPEWLVKGGAEFWLPLPEELLEIANSAIADYSALVRKSHGYVWPTRWVFASTRRVSRAQDDESAETMTAVPPRTSQSFRIALISTCATTREFYQTNQRMSEKAIAVAAWRDALLTAYVKAGGKPPRLSEA